jgi:ABC-type transporter MlaC component
MADHATGLTGGSITITACNTSNGNTIVAGRLSSGSSVVFRLSGNERIDDVTVSGISIAQALRSKFTGIIRDNGGDVNALISYLEQ